MQKLQSYIIVAQPSPNALAAECSKLVDMGYIPIGVVMVAPPPSPMQPPTFAQALYLPNPTFPLIAPKS